MQFAQGGMYREPPSWVGSETGQILPGAPNLRGSQETHLEQLLILLAVCPQMLVYMFYVLPFYGLATYALMFPGCSWLPDWALVFAGAIGQVRWDRGQG